MAEEHNPLPQNSSPVLPCPPSPAEALSYYVRLPSWPALVARTSTTPWVEPTGRWAYPKSRELCTIGNHRIAKVWEDDLAVEVYTLLDSMKVKWTSIDVVRIRYTEDPKEPPAPAVLWIGVEPLSLSRDDGVVVAFKCLGLLRERKIKDIEVEIRESVVGRSAGPKLLTPNKSPFGDPAGIRQRLTASLGLPISAQSAPWAEGTGGFFITEGAETKRLLLVTTRHTIFKDCNKPFEYDGQNRYNIMLFGDPAFRKYLGSIQEAIRGGGFDREPDGAKRVVEELRTLCDDVLTHWATPESRVLGHVILSPPISVGVGTEGYTEDWAVIEIDPSKVNASNFEGNVIDLGHHKKIAKLPRVMRNPELDRLLKFNGTIPDEEMRRPITRDEYGKPCLMVTKRGSATGLTVGRANEILSYIRYDGETSKEWAILPLDSESGSFSAKGDSGSVIVDVKGRIGGLLTGGTGCLEESDVVYATPINFLLKRMQDRGLHEPNVNPVLTT